MYLEHHNKGGNHMNSNKRRNYTEICFKPTKEGIERRHILLKKGVAGLREKQEASKPIESSTEIKQKTIEEIEMEKLRETWRRQREHRENFEKMKNDRK